MRKIASIGVAVAALTLAALPALADDQSIGFATGTIGGASVRTYDQHQPDRSSSAPIGVSRRHRR